MDILKTHRLTIYWDQEQILGTSMEREKPQDLKEIIPFLKEVISILESPEKDMPDPEVLGKYSPSNGKIL